MPAREGARWQPHAGASWGSNDETCDVRVPLPPNLCAHTQDEAKPWVKEALGLEPPGRAGAAAAAARGKKPRSERERAPPPEPVEGLSKVISLSKLRTSYARFAARRELVARYDLFLCDDRIVPMLTKTLGKTFFKPKKVPVPVRLTRSGSALAAAIRAARDATHVTLRSGSCVAARVARTVHGADAATENVIAAAAQLIQMVPGKWKNVASVSLKTDESAALPVFVNHAGQVADDDLGEGRLAVSMTALAANKALRPPKKSATAMLRDAAAVAVADGRPAKKRKAADVADGDVDELSDDERAAAALDAATGAAPGATDAHTVSIKKAKPAATGANAPPKTLKAKSPLVRAAARDARSAPAEAASPSAPAKKTLKKRPMPPLAHRAVKAGRGTPVQTTANKRPAA